LWAVVAGGVLSLTGSVFQTIFQNPLASPYTLGLASGSAIGALSAFLLGLTSIFSTSLLATMGGVTSAILLILVPKSRIKDKAFLLLCGIAYASFVSSLSMVLQSFVDTSTAYTYMRWMLGGLAIEDYYSLFLIPLSILSLLPILVYSNQITSLGIDSDIAQVNGSRTTAIRNLVLLFSTLAISVVVAQTGPISFIGLVIPNILFRYYGVNLKPILPISFLVGSIAVLFCDIVTRIMEYYTVLPLTTGVTISVIGSPVLIYLLFKTKEC
jgi:iron complex transport system permease protein